MSLSDKRHILEGRSLYWDNDVEEFIKELKEYSIDCVCFFSESEEKNFLKIIDQLAGPILTGEKEAENGKI